MDPSTLREDLLGSSTDRAERGLAQLKSTQRVAADTERLGHGILGELHGQRGQLEDAVERREDVEANLHLSSRLIRRMTRRATTTKCLMNFFIFLLFAAILVVVFFKWISPLVFPDHHDPHHQGRQLLLRDEEEGMRRLQEDRGLGVGIVLILVFGGLCVAATGIALPARPAKRVGVWCVFGGALLILLCVLFLAEKKDYDPSLVDPREEARATRRAIRRNSAQRLRATLSTSLPRLQERLTSPSSFLRVLLFAVLVLSFIVGVVGVIVNHTIVTQYAPKLPEADEGSAAVVRESALSVDDFVRATGGHRRGSLQ